MLFQKTPEPHNYWISYTDLVTGFLILFIVISIILLNRKEGEYTVNATYRELQEGFQEEFSDVANIEVTDEATLRFISDQSFGQSLFEINDYHPTGYFMSLLERAIPIYFKKLESVYLRDSAFVKIKEIRIEGHTDSIGAYYHNLKLSADRAGKIQEIILLNPGFQQLDSNFIQFVRQNTISCGYSYSRLLDTEGQLFRPENGGSVDRRRSRRVEFRVLIEETP